MTPLAPLLMIASGSIHAVVNAIVKGGRDKMAGRALTDGSSAIILLPATLLVPLPAGAWGWLAASGLLHAFYLFALVRAYQTRREHRESIAGVSAGFFGLDVAQRKVRRLSYFHCLDGLRLPILMVSGRRKAADHPNAAEPGAYFSEQDRAQIVAAYAGTFAVTEIEGAGHRLLKTHPDQAIAAIRPFLELGARPPAA